ncbi:7257_t:CDS:2 [Ambispora leptoticha]|uniref:7257_t:CDS:1 n=1 Tax=Ambispora leptoticha TaxID=144679 RepID=A0A9N9AJ07_9GLOM|nr:7257_t:CDS:2 [Ambispora leptoticha]
MPGQYPLTIPTFLQPLIQAWSVWIMTTFFSIPVAFFYMFWDFPSWLLHTVLPEKPKVILITGASSGIGAELAKTVMLTLCLFVFYGLERLQKVEDRCKNNGANVEILECDIANTERLITILNDFDQRHPIDLIFANAAQAGATIDDEHKKRWEDSWKRVMAVNLIGTVTTIMTVFKRMKGRHRGQIAITSSIAGYFAAPQMCYYNATKSALNSFGRDLRYLGQSYNVKVNVINPGFITSQMTLDQAQPLALPAFLLANPMKLANVIKWQLDQNNDLITWPFWEFLPIFATNTLPPRVLDTVIFVIGRFWGYFTKVGDRAFT